MLGCESLDRRLRAHWREDRRKEIAMRRRKNARASAVVFRCDLEFKHEGDYNGRGAGLEIGD